MITLYAFGPLFGLCDASPFVTKTLVHLKMSGLAFSCDYKGFEHAPKGKQPYIRDGETVIADSVFIRDYLEATYNLDFDQGLDPIARAQSWAIERMLEDHLYWGIMSARWLIPDNFEKGPRHFFQAIPEEHREGAIQGTLEAIQKRTQAHGLGLHTPHEQAAQINRSLTSLSVLLGDKAFMFGDTPTGLDASAFGMVEGVLCDTFSSPYRDHARTLPNLITYRERMRERFFAD
ncbi:glutathione S-transferase family protein [Woodsholea maritima]|uniref:glutathione S-transferase family protein n=1 Tax=Woodsholea maritima TaxID=240237 RepID=UPI00035DBB9E|nr:glutathione S-transferase family protein [Woodsholea maritima]